MPMKNTLRDTKAVVEVKQDTEITLPSDPLGSEEMSTLPGIEEEVEVEQDAEMTLPSDPGSAAILRRDAFPGVEEKIEIEQDLDMDMASASDYASGKEQDGESDQDEEEHITHLLEGGEAESTAGKQNRKLSRAWCMNLLLEPEDNGGTNLVNLQEDRHQDRCDCSSERDAPVSTQHGLERHAIQTLGFHNLVHKTPVDNEASVTPHGGDGPVHDTCTQSVRREGVAKRLTISGLEDEHNHDTSVPTLTAGGQVEDTSRAEVSNVTSMPMFFQLRLLTCEPSHPYRNFRLT
jgi:hypothetical protein